MKLAIISKIKFDLSPRYIPNSIFQVSEIPTTLNGKKLEIPIKKILNGTDVEKAVNLGTVKNPEALNEFIKFRWFSRWGFIKVIFDKSIMMNSTLANGNYPESSFVRANLYESILVGANFEKANKVRKMGSLRELKKVKNALKT